MITFCISFFFRYGSKTGGLSGESEKSPSDVKARHTFTDHQTITEHFKICHTYMLAHIPTPPEWKDGTHMCLL